MIKWYEYSVLICVQSSASVSNHSVAVFANSYLSTDANYFSTGDWKYSLTV